MADPAPRLIHLLATSLVAAVVVIGAPITLGTGGLLHQWSGLDFHYLTLPVVLIGVLLFLNRIVLGAQGTRLAESMVWRPVVAERQHAIDVLPVAQSLLAGAAWIALVWGLLASVGHLPATISMHASARDVASAEEYLTAFDTLALWAVLFLAPFAIARAASAFWPDTGRVLWFPKRRLVLLAVGYVLISDNGVLSTWLEVPVAQFGVVLTLAVALAYVASVLRNVSRSELQGWLAPAVSTVSPVVDAAVVSVVPAMAVWVTLSNLPAGGARLLDYSLTEEFGATYLAHFSNLFDVRYAAAGLCLTIGLALALPNAMGTLVDRYQPLMAAIGYSVAGCLAWIVGASLSQSSPWYTLSGAIAASGMFSLAVTQLAGYMTRSSNLILAESGRWLSESRVRGFTLGAAAAFYGLLLRPALHEVMWFAALYEYLALLALMILVLLRIGRQVRSVDPPDAPFPVWQRWSHHEHRLETKEDPRLVLMRDLRYRFLEYGAWRPVWSYLIGLLYRSQAPLESVEVVCQTLRRAALARARQSLPGAHRRIRSKRMAALEESFTKTEEGLVAPAQTMAPVDESALRHTAAAYVQGGTDPEKLAATLILAHYQKSGDLGAAADRWFPLLSAPGPSSRWYEPPWVRSRVRARERDQRARWVEQSVAYLFGAASESCGCAVVSGGCSS